MTDFRVILARARSYPQKAFVSFSGDMVQADIKKLIKLLSLLTPFRSESNLHSL